MLSDGIGKYDEGGGCSETEDHLSYDKTAIMIRNGNGRGSEVSR